MPDISRLSREYGRYNLTHTVTYRERTVSYDDDLNEVITFEDFTIWAKVSTNETETRFGVYAGIFTQQEYDAAYIVRWDNRIKIGDQIVDSVRPYNVSKIYPLIPNRWQLIVCVTSE